jgi:hypothetical protein
VAAITAGVCAMSALPAQAQAEVVHEQCGWGAEEPGDEVIPGTGITETVHTSFCQIVFTPAGVANAVLRGQAPEGYEADRAVVDRHDFGRTVVTPSGRIIGTGQF